MGNRHLPRLCQHCYSPMGAPEETCWRCGADWVTERPKVALRLISGGAAQEFRPASTAQRLARLVAEARP